MRSSTGLHPVVNSDKMFNCPPPLSYMYIHSPGRGRGQGYGRSNVRKFGWGCAARTTEPLDYTRLTSAEFCYPVHSKSLPILE